MDIMSGEKFTNARVHDWLTPEIEAVTNAMHTTRIQLDSAALWLDSGTATRVFFSRMRVAFPVRLRR